DKKVEQPVHQFLKVVMNLRTELEWRLTKAISKEDPQDKDLKFKWSLL
ncbi:14359_t:CDS:1, partial [Gigaspora rosea]